MLITEVTKPDPTLSLLLEAHRGPWSRAMTAEEILGEAGQLTRSGEVLFRRAPLYQRTKALRVDPYDKIRRKFQEFMHTKRANPIAMFGSKDQPFVGSGRYGQAIPGLRHAHITHDLSIVYRIAGREIYLYGFFTHDDLGTGTPPNLKRQEAMAAQLSNQPFG